MSCNFSILFESDDYLVVNKPAGCMVHADGKSNEHTLSDELVKQYPAIKGVGESWESPDGGVIERPGIVHRLDRDTSGVMVVAKTQEMFVHLKQQFKDRDVEKLYRAFVYGNIKEDSGVIDKPIAKSRKDFRLWSAQPGSRGMSREAVTHFEVIQRFGEATYVSLQPKTGRTHQLRVHMKAIHHPIVCDPLYAPNRESLFGFERLVLHAYSLAFKDLKGEKRSFKAVLPQDFERALERLAL